MLKLEGHDFWKHRCQTPCLVFLPSILSCLWQIHRATSCTIYMALECMLQSKLPAIHTWLTLHLMNCLSTRDVFPCCYDVLYIELSSVRFNQLFPLWHFILPFCLFFIFFFFLLEYLATNIVQGILASFTESFILTLLKIGDFSKKLFRCS